MLLAEILLVRFRKLPFTCTYPPFEHSAVVVVIVYVLGFLAFAGVTSELEFDTLMNPAAEYRLPRNRSGRVESGSSYAAGSA